MKKIAAALLSLSMGALSAQAAWPTYQATILGDLPGGLDLSRATDINDHGVVVGESHVGNGSRTFIWDADQGMRQLYPDGYPAIAGVGGYQVFPVGYHNGSAYINDNGTVAGRIGDSAGGYVYSSSSQPLRTYASDVRGINDQGQFAWVQATGANSTVGYIGTVVAPQALMLKGDTASSPVQPIALNNAGQVVGQINRAGYWEAVIWNEQGHPVSLGTKDEVYNKDSRAVAINANGMVAGVRYNTVWTASSFIWTASGGLVDLGLPLGETYAHQGPIATDINDAGVVIGTYGNRSFYWTEDTGMRFLDQLIDTTSPMFQNFSATAINNLGQIVGTVQVGTNAFRAVVLTPVPELSTWAMLALGIALMGLARKYTAR